MHEPLPHRTAVDAAELPVQHNVYLDVETFGVQKLDRVGAYKYATDPSTDILVVGFAIDRGAVQQWSPGNLPPSVNSTFTFVAHGNFDFLISKYILTARYGWPELPIERWRDTQAAALALGLPARLSTQRTRSRSSTVRIERPAANAANVETAACASRRRSYKAL